MVITPVAVLPILRQTPVVLDGLLRNVDGFWATCNLGPDTFSPFDVVGHLIHGERVDWLPRLQIILQHGESRPFDPFDRYAMYEASRGQTIADLLDTFADLRAVNIETLVGLRLTETDLEGTGTHPELGVVTARELLAAWTVHDLHHIGQIVKTMARQCVDEVGVWGAYLSILHP